MVIGTQPSYVINIIEHETEYFHGDTARGKQDSHRTGCEGRVSWELEDTKVTIS